MTKPTKWVCAQRKLRSALTTHWTHCEDSGQTRRIQADLSLRWEYSHFVGFVMSWLIFDPHTCTCLMLDTQFKCLQSKAPTPHKPLKENIANIRKILQHFKQRIYWFEKNYLYEKIWVFDFSKLALVCMVKISGAWHAVHAIAETEWHYNCVVIATEKVILWWLGNFTRGECLV